MAEHRIARQIVEIVAGDRDSAGALADRIAAAAPALAATLARRFDAAEDGRRRRIDRLVLTLDPCDPADFEASLVAHLDSALARTLPQQLARVAASEPAEDAIDVIAVFLRSGVLPWWASGPAALAEAAETLIDAEESGGRSVVAGLRRLLGEPDAATRLVRALPAQMLPRLAACLAGLRADDLATLAILLTAEQRAPDPGAGATHVWSSIMVAAAQEVPRSTPEAFGEEVRARLALADAGQAQPSDISPPAPAPVPFAPLAAMESSQRRSRAPEERSEPDKRRDTRGLPDDGRLVDRDSTSPRRPEFRAAGEQPADTPSSDIAPPFILDSAMTERPHARPAAAAATNDSREPRAAPPRPHGRPTGAGQSGPIERSVAHHSAPHGTVRSGDAEQRIAAPATEHDSIYIEAAGTILLGPFLADYFAAAGLIDSVHRFVTPAAPHRAVVLVDYLATGDRDPPESRLALAKLLAGMPIDTVLATAPLDDAEAAAADALLAAVLAELPMLGRLTVDGFRSAWLHRPGVLTVEHGGWLLRVERRGWDVLLERVPWPLDWLQLPWQPEGIRVEW